MMTNRIVPLPAAVAAALFFAACSESTAPRVPTTIEVDQQSVSLEVGDTVLVTARILDQHGAPFTEPPPGVGITWTTTNSAVATVNDGEIAGTGAGQATIRAQAGSLTPVDVAVQVAARTLTGQISFDYSGDDMGTFVINSTFQILQNGPNAPEWVVTFHDADFGSQDILAVRLRTDGRVDIVWFWVIGAVTVPVTRTADDGFILFGFSTQQNTAEALYELTTGSVTFSSITARQSVGTFQLSLVDPDTDAQIQVTNGAFDVPVVRPADIGIDAAGAAAIERAPLRDAFDAAGILEQLRRLRAVERR